jgi:alkylhydroperoxidase family enzyme
MPRVSYIEEKDHPEISDLIGKIKGGRGKLINIYKLLLHSPPLTATWLEFINATRKTKLNGRMRELAIVRVATNAQYPYALQQHVPNLAGREGVTEAECAGLKDWRGSGLFNEAERALLAYVDAVQASPDVPDDVFANVRKHFDEREVVELTIIIGVYLMHHRVFTTLRVDVESQAMNYMS